MSKNIQNIIFATSNQNKIIEVNSQLQLPNINIISLKELDFHEEVPETADTFKGNALQKAKYIHDIFKTNVFAEDTGLEVFSLGMKPGVKTARYAGEQRNNEDNINLLLQNLMNKNDRTAQFKTVIALIYKNQNYFFEGIAKGEIDFKKSGTTGFGYDPIFIPEGFTKSFAHFTKEEKNKISHRGKAVNKLIKFLENL